MTKGRKPKPTNLKILEGNPGKRKLNKSEPQPKPVKPRKPAWLAGPGAKMWKELSPQLESMGILTSIDGAAFAAACREYGTYVECVKELKKNGLKMKEINTNGDEVWKPRLEIAVGNQALKQFRMFCVEFGLTPSSRGRLSTKEIPDENDPMKGLLTGLGNGK